ncbi:conjugative transposon protein TraN [Chitinophaga sp. CC14]|uniref:conjugative transposon protein TraN n=1 Tax=Chitinophaga sp. CC14 TaxID=3029199 RepID=UPI003B80F125
MCKGKLVRSAKLFIFLLLLYSCPTLAQHPISDGILAGAVSTENLEITTGQTSILVFPKPIKRHDRGSSQILTKTINGIDNVLKVKAEDSTMRKTNLTVFTTDGHIYSFQVDYSPVPAKLVYPILPDPRITIAPAPTIRLNEARIVEVADSIALTPGRWIGKHSKKSGGMQLHLTGIYLKDAVMFFQFSVSNHSPIPYNIDFTRFFIQDSQQGKKTINAEKEALPLLKRIAPMDQVDSGKKVILVVAFDKFTIADRKVFTAQVYEKNGDRHLTMKLKGKVFLKAKPVSP